MVVPNHEALVLYLAGAADLDREIAIRHGFKNLNLIAVESDKLVISSLRKKGVLVVDGKIQEVIQSWRPSRYVDLLVCDFCSGWEPVVIDTLLSNMMANPSFFRSVIVINVMRGRDARSNERRQEILSRLSHSEKEIVGKHRGRLIAEDFIKEVAETLNEDCDDNTLPPEARYDRLSLLKMMSPRYFSYRSETGQVFDSVVFRQYTAHDMSDVPQETWDKILHDETKVYDIDDYGGSRRTQNKISAILAHRTMRTMN
jgi:hypothetical protein